ncbi:hypothetical protein F5887DRAFT_1243468 [Amanita rubescens]|nr:hypothetical protein F5887DRAFT_1243468 [Amanita rubescens]
MAGSAHRRGGSDSMAPPPTVSALRNIQHSTTGGRGRGRAKAADRPPKAVETPGRRRKTSSIDKGKQKQAPTGAEMNVDTDGDVAMKAAATLTSWLLHNRQPTAAGSPRSSFDESETDDEAADLMLLFATSPSPARPTVGKDARDMAAFRALSGGNNALLSKGRIWPPLTRGGDGSFSSSISSISSQLGRRGSVDASSGAGLSRMGSSSQLGPSQLLPPPPLPARDESALGATTPEHMTGRVSSTIQSPKSSGGHTTDFNFSDFINASPSPARPGAGQMLTSGSSGPNAQKPSLGLRADVGRKLFEEEQMRNATGTGAVTKSPKARGLGAGIDLDAMRS